MKEHHHVAVRSLVDAVLRAGDLDLRFAVPGRTLDGIRAHQRIQRQRPAGYDAEVPVSMTVETEAVVLKIGGRIDGVLETSPFTVVEEIKTTRKALASYQQTPHLRHWGQAKVYAYLFARQRSLDAVTVRLTYVHLDHQEILEQDEVHTIDALETFFQQVIDRYLSWAAMLSRWHVRRNASIGRLDFPFAGFRKGQRDMAVAVYRTLRDGGQALVQAATGIGKTMAVLFPAVKSLAEGHADRLFFLTARNTGKASAAKALNVLQEKGLRLKRVVVTAKERICFCPEAACNPEECRFARGHFDRLNEALIEAFAYDQLDRGAIEAVARSHSVCPFDFSLELACWADCIVCDYNYAFDPRVYVRRLFEEENGRAAFLVDEAHNLVDRSREMFSAELHKSAFLALRRAVKDHLPALFRQAGKINTWFLRAKRAAEQAGGFQSQRQLPKSLRTLLHFFVRDAEKWLANNRPAPYRDLVLDGYFQVSRFLRVWESFDDSYVTLRQVNGKDLALTLYCLDPSRQLKLALRRARAAVFFSATLTPTGYFQNILGCAPEANKLVIPSPFPSDRLSVLVAGTVSTYFAHRKRSAASIAALIRAFVQSKQGNYLVFFPSYAYMDLVAACMKAPDDVLLLVQEPEMDHAARTRFIERFTDVCGRTLVGFAVMGGIFGEGIDLVGEQLSGAVIVGVGLPAICPERDLIRDHFARHGSGFDFAYRYPGINRVLQAAGRVIRSASDRGALLLVDRRFRHAAYRRLLPAHWPMTSVVSPVQVKASLERFWSQPQGTIRFAGREEQRHG